MIASGQSPLSELDLIKRVKDDQDSNALTQLIDLHTGIYVTVVKKYECYPDFRNKVEARDLLDDKAYHIYQFIRKYEPSHGMTLGSYIGDSIKHLCQNTITRSPQSIEFNENVAPSNDTSIAEATERGSSIETILDQVKGSDSAMFRQIFKLRFCGKKPLGWRAIGEAVGMSHEGARKVYEKHIGAVKEHLKT